MCVGVCEVKDNSRLGRVAVSVRSAHGARLVHRAQPAFPMTTCFKSALVACAAFSGFNTEKKKNKKKKSKKQQVIDIIKLKLALSIS